MQLLVYKATACAAKLRTMGTAMERRLGNAVGCLGWQPGSIGYETRRSRHREGREGAGATR